MSRLLEQFVPVLVIAVVVVAAAVPQAVPQNRETPAIQESTAQKKAEEVVALSADSIISLLNREPGLVLEVKRMLVRRAHAQGQILRTADLTDDALFTLIREDDSVRVLATREIEDRNYIRVQPARPELLQGTDDFSSSHRDGSFEGTARSPASQTSHLATTAEEAPAEPAPHAARRFRPEQPWPWQLPTSAGATRRTQSISERQDSSDNLGGENRADAALSPSQPPAASKSRVVANRSLAGSAATSSRGFPQVAGLEPSSAQNADPDRTSLASRTPRVSSPGDFEVDDEVIERRPVPYSDVPALRELYSRVLQSSAPLERFGSSILRNGSGNLDGLPMDLPAGPEYVVGPGDGLDIEVWGAVSQRLQRVIDRQGRVALPEVGGVQVAGRTLGEVQHLVQAALETQLHDVEADVSLSRIRSVRVYVAGDVVSPGAYDISSLSTPLNAVHAAGGPTPRGSLRHLQQFRGKELVQEIDAYDLLLHGMHSEMANMQPGDTILVPPAGAELTVSGMVRRPAIYELNGEKSLAEVLDLAGGVLASGMLRNIDVERVIAHQRRTMIRVELADGSSADAGRRMREFLVQDGDRINISPILAYSEQVVFLDGHVFRPGKYPYREGMKVVDLVRSYDDILPEPSQAHAEIIRLEPPDYAPRVVAFKLSDAMSGENPNLALKPFDTVRIFSRYAFEDLPLVTVNGAVRDPGDHVTNGVTRLRDALYLAGGLTADAELENAQVFRSAEDRKVTVLSVNLRRALAGEERDNILLKPKDRVFIRRSHEEVDPASVVVEGEVAWPGRYPLGKNMTAVQLINVAGGLKRSAFTDSADLTRYDFLQAGKVRSEHMRIELAKALGGESEADVQLRDGDLLTVKQIAGWRDIGATISVRGEVTHPGEYGIENGERLSSILARAGGFRPNAYPYGAIFERAQVRELEQETREQLIRQVQADGTSLNLIPDSDPDEKAAKEAAVTQWQSALQRLKQSPPSGRLVIHLGSDVKRWAGTANDVAVHAGDVIYIPRKPNFVLVEGCVYNPTAILYKPGRNVAWYLRQAGGPTNTANKRGAFVIHADGSVDSGQGGIFGGGVERAALRPGDLIMVPERAFSGTTRWKATLESAQLAYAVGIAVQVARSF